MSTELSSWLEQPYFDDTIVHVTRSDIFALGEVMHEAYEGTIDHHGESLEDAREEIAGTFNGKYGPLVEEACLLIKEGDQIASAIIVTTFKDQILIVFVMTRAIGKGRGFAKKLIKRSLSVLAQNGFKECALYVTVGNEPAVSIYKSLGFKIKEIKE
jgi:GNAT superfamily N-acetyltransferase